MKCSLEELKHLTKEQQRQYLMNELKDAKMKLDRAKYRKQKLKDNIELIADHPLGPQVALKSLLEKDISGETNNLNIEQMTSFYDDTWSAEGFSIFETLGTTWGDVFTSKEIKRLDTNILKEMNGFETGDLVAKETALKIQNLNKKIEKEMNDYYLPFTRDVFDRQLILDSDLEALLKKVSDPAKAKELALQLKTKARLHQPITTNDVPFTSAEGVVTFQQELGNSTVLQQLVQTIKHNAELLADQRVVGGKANWDRLRKAADLLPQKEENLKGARGWLLKARSSWTLNAQYKVVTGEVDRMGNVGKFNRYTAKGLSQARGVVNTALLGNVIFSSIGDVGQGAAKSITYGTKGHTIKAISNLPNTELQDTAARIGYGLEHLKAQTSKRFNEDGYGGGTVEKVNSFFMGIGGIGRWTQSFKSAATLVDHADVLERLKKATQTGEIDPTLEAEFITPEKLEMFKGLDFDSEYGFVDWPEEARLTVYQIVDGRRKEATLEPGSATRAFTTGGMQKGTAGGEAARFFMQITSFIWESINKNVLNPITKKQQPGVHRWKGLAVGSAAMMAIAWLGDELRNLSKNRTPEDGSPFGDTSDPEKVKAYWVKKFIKYNLWSPVTEAASAWTPYRSEYKSKKSLGVTFDAGWDIYHAVQDDFLDDTGNKGRTWKKMNQYMNPLNIFWTNALYYETVFDFIGEMLDENYEIKKERKLRRRERETGQEVLF